MDIFQLIGVLSLILSMLSLGLITWCLLRGNKLSKRILKLELAKHGETSGHFSVYNEGNACVQHYKVSATLRAIMKFLNIQLMESEELTAIDKEKS